MSLPVPSWKPGNYPATRHWLTSTFTRDHGPYDQARAWGQMVATNDDWSGLVVARGDRFVWQAHARTRYHGAPPPADPCPVADGTLFDTVEDAERAQYDAGLIGFRRVHEAPIEDRTPAVPRSQREEYDPGVDYDPDGRYSDGAAADMVYGRDR